MKTLVNIFWFRRDLRLDDNAGLYHALRSQLPVLPLFIFDKNILDDLEDPADRRVNFIYEALAVLKRQLRDQGSDLLVHYGKPAQVFEKLLHTWQVQAVFTNEDYEQYAIDRDGAIATMIRQQGGAFHSFKDQVMFSRDEILKDDGKPYTVFTPYSKRWKATLNDYYLKSYPNEKYFHQLLRFQAPGMPALEQMGFQQLQLQFPDSTVRDELIEQYHLQRDFPGVPGTSRLSVHLRFGTISIRRLTRQAMRLNEKFLNELIWRDFYHMILWQMPHVRKGFACKPAYDRIQWRNNEQEFDAWCRGMTGYPIVDAGMRELNATGYMHNRVRMIVASFLCKHLLIDWRWGESYFAKKLLDYDFAANNGGWQWSAGSGCDAAPYFRIFSPKAQTEKFDQELRYIRTWVPELDSFEYPQPIVDHEKARKRCLEVYQKAVGNLNQ